MDNAALVAPHSLGRSVPDGVGTDVGVCPHVFALVADSGVPFLELLKADAEFVGDCETHFILLDEVEAVTVLHHAGLDGEGGCDAIVTCCGFNGCGLEKDLAWLLGCGVGWGGKGQASVGEEEGGDGRELHCDV